MYALIDCNNFFVSCERVFRPELVNRPVAVLSNNDGCIIARSQQVKDMGIPMGAPVFEHKRVLKDRNVVLFSANFQLYADMSSRVMSVLQNFVPEVEVYSVDEAFLNLKNLRVTDYEKFAEEIKNTVMKWTGIPVSVGIAPTKTLTKVANEHAKKMNKGGKTAFVMETEEEINAVLQNLEVGEIWGIGRALSQRLKAKGIFTALDLKNTDERWGRSFLSVMGQRIIFELRGIQCISTDKAAPESRKSILSSRSFSTAVTNIKEMKEAVASFVTIAAEKLRKQKSVCSIVHVAIRTSKHKYGEYYSYTGDFTNIPTPTDYTPDIIKAAHSVLEKIYKPGIGYKKASIMLTGIVPADSANINMFQQDYNAEKNRKIMNTVDIVNKKFGKMTLKAGSIGFNQKWRGKRENVSNRYTTRWEEIPEVKA